MILLFSCCLWGFFCNFAQYRVEFRKISGGDCGGGVRAVCFIREAVCGWRSILPQQKTRESHAGWYVLIGICAAVPCLMVLVLLLMSADMVFADLLVAVCGSVRFPVKLLRILLMLVFGFLSSYCGVRYVQKHAADIKPSAGKTAEPLIAIAFTAPIAVLYLLFSAIQIVYLFIGNMQRGYLRGVRQTRVFPAFVRVRAESGGGAFHSELF